MINAFRTLPRRLVVLVLTFVLATVALSILALFVLNRGWAEPVVATWYGPGFEGAPTASGEPFDPMEYTAAHRTLPLGKKLIVSYGGCSVVVRVNDRGPFSMADLDLSKVAAELLGMTGAGVATVEVASADFDAPARPRCKPGTAAARGVTGVQGTPEPALPQAVPPSVGEVGPVVEEAGPNGF